MYACTRLGNIYMPHHLRKHESLGSIYSRYVVVVVKVATQNLRLIIFGKSTAYLLGTLNAEKYRVERTTEMVSNYS